MLIISSARKATKRNKQSLATTQEMRLIFFSLQLQLLILKRNLSMSLLNDHGIFLHKHVPGSVKPNEVIVSIRFASKEDDGSVALDSKIMTASSYDGGKTYSLSKTGGLVDGYANDEENAQLLALAKAYAAIKSFDRIVLPPIEL
jgi:hypothetical protein